MSDISQELHDVLHRGALRHTCIGMLPVNVTSIDRLDQRVTELTGALHKMADIVADMAKAAAAAQPAVEYAEAHTARRRAHESTLQRVDVVEVRRRWKRARKEYDRSQREEYP